MNASATQLLKLLGSGIRPLESLASKGAPGVAPGAFADLLQKAQAGGLASNLPVTIGSDAQTAGVQLDQDQLARLSIAADQLETAGVRNALVTIDGQKLTLDVHARQITGRADGASGLVGGIDGAIDLGDARAGTAGAALAGLAGAAGVALNGAQGAQAAPSLVRQIGPPAATLSGSASAMNLLASLTGGRFAGAGP